MTDISRRQLSA